MEKEKKKFNLSSLLRIYLGKNKKSLHCHSCRPPSASDTGTDPAPPPGRDWMVKLSQLIYIGVAGVGLRRGCGGLVDGTCRVNKPRICS